MFHIHLKAENLSENISREYHCEIEKDLFGAYTCMTSWGRSGSRLRSKIVSFEDEALVAKY